MRDIWSTQEPDAQLAFKRQERDFGITEFFVNVWTLREGKPQFYGDIHSMRDYANRATAHRPHGWLCPYRIRVRLKKAVRP